MITSVLLGAGGGCSSDDPSDNMDMAAGGADPAPASVDGTIVPGPLTPVVSGLPDGTGYSARYVDNGSIGPNTPIRMLIGYPLRAEAQLDQVLRDLYDPTSPHFRAYLTKSDFMASYGPDPKDTSYVESWLTSQGLKVAYTASNHLIIQVKGTAGQFNQAFGIALRNYSSPGMPPVTCYGTTMQPRAPQAVATRISGLLLAQPATDPTMLAPDNGLPSQTPPSHGVTLSRITQAYGVTNLSGFTGQGVRIGIIAGGGIRASDVQSFWQGQGVNRNNPIVREVLDPPTRYVEEATLDAQWAGGIAPGADIIMYAGPDPLDISVSYLFNEAIGAGEVQVVSTSFSHHESDRPPILRLQHESAAKMASALGITTVAASGDSADIDTPASCPHVTAVGGTVLTGSREAAWAQSGSGLSGTFNKPYYQTGVPLLMGEQTRANADLALNVQSMVYYFGGQWHLDSGTSFATPAFAGMVAVLNSARAARKLPRVGFLNPLLYTNAAVQGTFHDIVSGGTTSNQAAPGWDYPTGWGSPNLAALVGQLP
jgi:kumamolisin